MPDKAEVDLMDEACAMVRTEIDFMPQELDDLRRELLQMQIEITALKKREEDEVPRKDLLCLKRKWRKKAEIMILSL